MAAKPLPGHGPQEGVAGNKAQATVGHGFRGTVGNYQRLFSPKGEKKLAHGDLN
jgi:hypothetical protein